MEKIPKFNKHRAFNKAVGPWKNPKLIKAGPKCVYSGLYPVVLRNSWINPGRVFLDNKISV